MAGDWIKMRNDLFDDPAVIAIARAVDIGEDVVVGKLHRLWSWADRHTKDGNAIGVTASWINRFLSVTGFAEAMIDAGWLAVNPTGVEFPNFSKHNGESSKQRALTAKRVARHKASKRVTHRPLPREEKRREEKPPTEVVIPGFLNTPEFASAWIDWQSHRREIRKPLTPQTAKAQIAKVAAWGAVRATAAIRHSIAGGWQGIFEPNDSGRASRQFSGLQAFAEKHGVQTNGDSDEQN